ncbi:MAG: response regulator [Methylococcaceae bacterium]
MNKQEPVVYIIDDEFVIRDSLTLLLESAGHTVKSYASAEDFLDGFNPTQPGCLILDVKMPVMSGLELQEELVRRMVNIPIIFMSGNSEIPDTVKALKAGAVDFLEKPFGNDVLQGLIKEAIEKDIRNKEKNLGQAVLQQRIARLTPREKEVLTLVVKSHSNKEAARILNVSHRTIDVHRARIMEKMQAQDIAELVTIAMQCGVVV